MKQIKSIAVWSLLTMNAITGILLLISAFSPYISPVSHPYLSCSGLAFPIFLVLNLMFLVPWLLFRCYKCALVPLLFFALSIPAFREFCPFHFRSSVIPSDSLKVLSYNVMSFNGDYKEDGKNSILEYLKESDADIICLMEYQVINHKNYLSQKDVDKALKAYRYHRIGSVGEKGCSNRIACYSKLPILGMERIKYESEANGSYLFKLKWGEDVLFLIANHLESNKLNKDDKDIYREMMHSPESRTLKKGSKQLLKKLGAAAAIRAVQADSVHHRIEQLKGEKLIVCGDFNDIPLSYAHRTIAKGMTDAFKATGRGVGISYHENRFYFRIDHILCSPALKPYNCTVDRSIKDSDHYPIWCYIVRRDS